MNFWQPCRNFSRQTGMKVAEIHLCNNLENFPSNTFFSTNTSGHVDCSSDNRNGKNFSKGCHHFIQSPKTTRKMLFFGKNFSSKDIAGHVICKVVKPDEKFRKKTKKKSRPNSKKLEYFFSFPTCFFFWKCSFGHIDCCFNNPGKKLSAVVEKYSLKIKNLELLNLFFSNMLSSSVSVVKWNSILTGVQNSV